MYASEQKFTVCLCVWKVNSVIDAEFKCEFLSVYSKWKMLAGVKVSTLKYKSIYSVNSPAIRIEIGIALSALVLIKVEAEIYILLAVSWGHCKFYECS